MKLFQRLPRWLRFSGLAAFVALCVGVNAIAFTEISRSLQSRPPLPSSAPPKTARIKISPIQPKATSEPATPSPAENQLVENQKVSSSPTSADSFISTKTSTPISAIPAAEIKADGSKAIAPQTPPIPKYGHLPYTAKNPADMVQIASYPEGETQRTETLHPDAAKALLDMIAAARADGIWLVPASGFRTLAQQRTLFNAQVAKQKSPEAAAKISAPPGYSEHHTGYAVDLTDGTFAQNQDISPAFASAPAYQWLLKNAATHGFELSFPENNPQGISFEPWHWRYVGTRQARVTFGKDRPPIQRGIATEQIIE